MPLVGNGYIVYSCYLDADDYLGLENFRILLNPGNNHVQVPVFITDDSDLEPNEQLIVHLELLSTSQAGSIGLNNVPLVIQDDDCEYDYGMELANVYL